ncbi:hypothetical protein FRX31_025457 [Thalictrum thalictroides]|uniref:Uncharacterized protein n=1 Tax=Thalictrum thalictroides TaxID=46969 RepID=A0A7J6VIL8_THATH|nr:hypothetical protein FRX31_025457 [Thalictrum thalictroides]
MSRLIGIPCSANTLKNDEPIDFPSYVQATWWFVIFESELLMLRFNKEPTTQGSVIKRGSNRTSIVAEIEKTEGF